MFLSGLQMKEVFLKAKKMRFGIIASMWSSTHKSEPLFKVMQL
jgi:hypothetical protein